MSRVAPPIAFVMTHYPQTAATFVSLEIRQLRDCGVDIKTFSINRPGTPSTVEFEREASATVFLKENPAGIAKAFGRLLMRHPVALGGLLWQAARLGGTDFKRVVWRMLHFCEALVVWNESRSVGVRHVHAQFGGTTANIAWFAAQIGTAFDKEPWTWSFTIHGFQDFVNEPDTRFDLKVESVAFVTCISDFTRSQLMRCTDPKYWRKYHVVRCGVELDKIPQRAAQSHSPRTIVLPARLSAEKGHVVLLDALVGLVADGFDLVVDCIGDGEQRAQLQREIDKRNMGDRFRLLGEMPHEQVLAHLRNADIFCLPSFAEGVPVSIMEAMACGVPVVTTTVGGIPEIAENGAAALLVAPGDSVSLQEAIAQLVTNSELRQSLITHARATIERSYVSATNVAAQARLLSATASK